MTTGRCYKHVGVCILGQPPGALVNKQGLAKAHQQLQ